jgi:hypothetical protein
MGDLNLNSDEGILHRTQTLIIRGIRYEAVFTKKRLILVTCETGTIHEDIPFSDISRAISGVNKLREPVLTLDLTLSGGEKRTIELIFIRLAIDQSAAELETCIGILRNQQVPIESHERQLVGLEFSNHGQRILPGESSGQGPVTRAQVPEWNIIGSPHHTRRPLQVEEPQLPPVRSIAVILIIIVILVIGMVVVGQVLNKGDDLAERSGTGANITKNGTPAASPVPTPAPSPQKITPTIPPPPELSAPKDGVWVNITYPGNYRGYLGSLGRRTGINSSGTWFYKIPVDDAMIEGSIEKMDGSGENLEVKIYNGGNLVAETGTSKPWGVVDIHEKIGPAIGNTVVIVPSSPVITVSPYTSLPQTGIPLSGVFVRIFSIGNFSGSIHSNGLITNVNSTGDQFFQIPITSGIVEGFIVKREGTVNNLIIVVYKDGKVVSETSTSTPLGVADFHAIV